jgi:hypothetical protein
LQVLALASFGVAICTLFLPSRNAAPGTNG